jgi:hypothetical protein
MEKYSIQQYFSAARANGMAAGSRDTKGMKYANQLYSLTSYL